MDSGKTLVGNDQSAPIAVVSRLAGSHVFDTLFKDGMALVDETAAYLDGPGRTDSRGLTRAGSLAYATESMRLTTRLMQLASWLLLQRAVNNGELTSAEAASEKAKMKLSGLSSATQGPGWEGLPMRMRELIERSARLQARIRRLDGAFGGDATISCDLDNPVQRQIGQIAEAFAGR